MSHPLAAIPIESRLRLEAADQLLGAVGEEVGAGLLEELGPADFAPDETVLPALVERVCARLVTTRPFVRVVDAGLLAALVRRQAESLLLALGGAVAAGASAEGAEAPSLGAEELVVGLEGFDIALQASIGDPSAVGEAVGGILGTTWFPAAETTDGATRDVFVPTPHLRAESVARAYDLADRLVAVAGIEAAAPSFILPVAWNAEEGPPKGAEAVPAGSGGGGSPLPGSSEKDWALEKIGAAEAWRYSRDEGRPEKGRGVRIGHPDTGYTWHREVDRNRLDLVHGYDFWRHDADPRDDMESSWKSLFSAGFFGNKGHGTGTASVLMSGVDDEVSGVAPQATLVPYRVTPTVVLFNMRRLAAAIRRAVDDGCDVISISLGGPGMGHRMRESLAYAERRGVIVCAAAGNHAPFVVSPARHETVVGVAASNADDRAWVASSNGPAVKITAPGQDVWRAQAGKKPDIEYKDTKRGDGTSYAVGHVAGVAALWVAHHGGREALGQRLGGLDRVAPTFRRILATVGHSRPPGIDWDKGRMGAGVVDAEAVLRAELASAGAVPVAAGPAALHPVALLFEIEGLEPADVESGLRRLLGPDLDRAGDELETLMALDTDAVELVRRRLAAELGKKAVAEPAGPVPAGAPATPPAAPSRHPFSARLARSLGLE